MERNVETYMNFPIVATSEHDQSQLPSSKRRHVEESPSVLHKPRPVSEEEGHVHSGNVARYDRDVLNQESQSSYSRVLDLERRIPMLSEHSHHEESHLVYHDEASRKDIPASEEGTQEVNSYHPQSTDEGQMCSPTNSLTLGSGKLQISGNCWTPATPMVTSPFISEVLDDHSSTFDGDENCQYPKTAEFDGNSEFCAVGPIVNIKKIPKLPSQFESIEESWEKFKSGREPIPNGGLEVCQVLFNEVKKKYSEHQNVFNERRLPRNLEVIRSESNEAEHIEKRLDDVRALKPVIKFVQHLEEELFIHLSQEIHHNLMKASRLCENAYDGSHMAEVYQALKCDKNLCVIEVHAENEGPCKKFPIVCLEGEKILHVVEEWLMKNEQGKRLHHKNLCLEACDSELVYPVGDSVEAFCKLHRVRLRQAADNPPSTSPRQPDFYGRGLSTTSYLQPVQTDWRCPHSPSNLMVQPGGNSWIHPPSRQQDFQFGTETFQPTPLRHFRVNNPWHPFTPPPLSNAARYVQQHTASVPPNVDFRQPSYLPPQGVDPPPAHYR